MLGDIARSDDILSAVCAHLTHVRELVKLSAVCKRTHQYLVSTDKGAHHWVQLAAALGITCEGRELRRRVICAMCPWTTRPVVFTPSFVDDQGATWRCTNILQWVLLKDKMHVRCHLRSSMRLLSDGRKGMENSAGLVLSAAPAEIGRVLGVFRAMDKFDDLEHSWSVGMERVYDTLQQEGLIPLWLGEMAEKEDFVRIFPIHQSTLVAVILDQQTPVLHILHVDTCTTKDGATEKKLRFLRTLYVPDMNVKAGNPVFVSDQQQIWMAQIGGSFKVWGLAHDYDDNMTRLKKPEELLYHLFCVLEDERFEKAVEFFERDKALLRAHCNLRMRAYHNNGTILHSALNTNYEEIIELILQAGADPNQTNDDGLSPMMFALTDEHIKIGVARLLHYFGGDPNLQNDLVDAPIHQCIDRCSEGSGAAGLLRDCILAGGVDIDLPSLSLGETPLAHAVRLGQPSVVACLLHHGARVAVLPTHDMPRDRDDTCEERLGREVVADTLRQARRLQCFLACV